MHLNNLINRLNPAAPKGLIDSADAWVAEHATPARQNRQPYPPAWSREVFPAEENIHAMDYAFAPTPGDEFSGVRWTATPAARLYYMQGCRILGEEGAVISPDNRVFADFTLPPGQRWADHSCFRRRRIPAVQPLKGWYATIAWPESKFFFHWMLESLPRMAVLGEHARILDGLFIGGPLQKFQREALAALGIAEDKLIPLSPDSHFAPEHLFVPRAFAVFNPPRWMHRWFKEACLGPAISPSRAPLRRIYVSRADAPARRVENEDEVIQALAPLGFAAVRPSELSFHEQARLFNEAEAIVAPHGAGLSNLVFCKPGTALLEIFPPRWMPPCFTALALSVGCRYRHVVADDAGSGPVRGPQFDHLRVRVPEMMEALRAVLGPDANAEPTP